MASSTPITTDDDEHLDQGKAAGFGFECHCRPMLERVPERVMRRKTEVLLPVFVLRAVQSGPFRFLYRHRRCSAHPRNPMSVRLASSAFPSSFRHGIDGILREKLQLLAGHVHALYQRFQVGRIAFASQLGLEGSAVGGVFVAVDASRSIHRSSRSRARVPLQLNRASRDAIPVRIPGSPWPQSARSA